MLTVSLDGNSSEREGNSKENVTRSISVIICSGDCNRCWPSRQRGTNAGERAQGLCACTTYACVGICAGRWLRGTLGAYVILAIPVPNPSSSGTSWKTLPVGICVTACDLWRDSYRLSRFFVLSLFLFFLNLSNALSSSDLDDVPPSIMDLQIAASAPRQCQDTPISSFCAKLTWE